MISLHLKLLEPLLVCMCVCVCVCVCVFMSVFSSRNYKLLVFLLSLSFQNLQNGILYARMLYCCCYLVAQSCLTLLQPHGLKPSRLLYPWDSPGQEYWSGLPCPPPGDLPYPGIEPGFLALWEDSLLSDPP